MDSRRKGSRCNGRIVSRYKKNPKNIKKTYTNTLLFDFTRHRKKQKEKQEEMKRIRLEKKRQLLGTDEESALKKLKQDERFSNINHDRFSKKKRTKAT